MPPRKRAAALFMVDLKHYIEDELGLKVVHIKTDSVKVATPQGSARRVGDAGIQLIQQFAAKYGYAMEVHADGDETPEIETINEFAINAGENLPNHSMSLKGLGKYVQQGMPYAPNFRTKQAAYRYAAWLITMAEVHLPDEEGAEAHDFEAVVNAIRST